MPRQPSKPNASAPDAKRLLLETKVGIAPGVAFGAGGEGSIRICYAADKAVLEQAMERLYGFLK